MSGRGDGKIEVVIADDSRTSRELLQAAFAGDPEISVVACAKSGDEAVALVSRFRPTLVLMDAEMANGDGIEATRRIMVEAPCPVLFISSLPHLAGPALSAGAVDFLAKGISPAGLRQAVKLYANVKVVAQSLPRARARRPSTAGAGRYAIIGIGASTGGPAALQSLLGRLPRTMPPIAIVQHVPDGFAKSLAEWLTQTSGFPVEVPAEGCSLEGGRAYLAPDGRHLRVDASLRAAIDASEPVNSVQPSVDVLFRTLAHNFRDQAIGIVLTGMGRDGAAGLLEMRRARARTIAQDAASCAIDGMPQAARALDAAEWVVPLGEMADALGRLLGDGAAEKSWLVNGGRR